MIKDFFMNQLTEEEMREGLYIGRISGLSREIYHIIGRYGEKNAKLKGSVFYQDAKFINYPAVGDYVVAKHIEAGDDIIYRILERSSVFTRNNPSIRNISMVMEQVVAANVDIVFLMLSLNQDFNLRRLERYLAVAWESGATPVIVLTKADIAEDIEDYVEQAKEIAPFVEIVAVSSHTGFGLEQLDQYLKPGETVVFLGSSGIGKSSLINALAGEEIMKVNNIRDDDDKGRHTTTSRELIQLKTGAILMDTPGMRVLGINDSMEGLSETFTDVEELAGQCRFGDCKHGNEPGCAVREAIENGTLSIGRLNSYQKLLKEAAYAKKKTEILNKKMNKMKNRRM